MPYSKPFPRIFLPQKNKSIMETDDFSSHPSYIDKRESTSLINAARIIIKDYKDLIDYIEPTNENKFVYSHRIYELLLRTATEFEANCKGILLANGYAIRRHFNIEDYHRLNVLMKLNQYELTTQLWSPEKTISPLSEWRLGYSLRWYQAYNNVKHNRYTNFHEATLENLFNGICCLITILAAQFTKSIGYLDGSGIIMTTDNDNEILISDFAIKYPLFTDDEKYEFDWDTLKNDLQPFNLHTF